MPLRSYSLRKLLQQRSGEPEVYIYDSLPPFLRHQITQAFHEGIGRFVLYDAYSMHTVDEANGIWEQLDQICQKEIWTYAEALVRGNSQTSRRDYQSRYLNFVLNEPTVDDVLSAIEFGALALRLADRWQGGRLNDRGARMTGEAALQEINRRFVEHGVGYQIERDEIIRVDSKLVHAEVIKPALSLLTEPIFGKANEDFMTAHRHYRAGEYKDSITSANRAFESLLKAICDAKRWTYAAGDNASQLISKVTENGLFTRDFDQSFTAYVAMMKSGIPAVRNKSGGHGDGIADARVTGEIARYALNLSATNILFVAECFGALAKRK